MTTGTEDRVVETFLEMAPLEGPSRNETVVAAYVRRRLEELGLEVREDQAGRHIGGTCGNLIVDLPASPGRRGDRILFSAHLDVVPPGSCPQPAVRDGFVVSDGDTVLGADDRAGVAALLVAAEEWSRDRAEHPPLRLIFCVAEETHLEGSRALEAEALEGCALGYVPDSASRVGNLVASTPSCATFEAVFRGRPAHAGVAPEEGRSAIQMLCRAVSEMPLGRLDDDTTANIGRIEGGEATNVVPDRARLVGECRSFRHERVEELLGDYEQSCRDAAGAMGGASDWVSQVGFKAYQWGREDEVVDRAWRACERLGIPPILGRSGGGSDANSFNEKGVPSINLGTGIRANHTPDERIAVDDLKLLHRLLLEIARDEE